MSDNLYAWQVYEDGEWNIVGAELPLIGMAALVTTGESTALALQPVAFKHHQHTGLPVRLARYNNPGVIDRYGDIA